MSKVIYLEPDEEITDVINKISKTDEEAVSLVIPRGSTLANSVVNLKLLAKKGKDLKKNVSIISVDKNAKNLAAQIGLPVFNSIDESKKVAVKIESIPESQNPDFSEMETEEINGVKVNKYDKDGPVDLLELEEAPAPQVVADDEVFEAVVNADDHSQEEIAVPPEVNQVDSDEKEDYKIIKKPMNKNFNSHDQQTIGSSSFSKMRDGKRKKKLILWSIGGVAVLLIVLGLFATLPKAKVKVSVVSEPISEKAEIKVDKNSTEIDFENLTIPGKSIIKEDTLEESFAASGTKNVGQKASGKITAYNNWDQNSISLPSGSIFISSSNIKFVSTAAITIPGAQVGLQNGQFVIIASGTADVNVESSEVGVSGNIAATNFTITSLPQVQQSKIYGKSTAAMSGGNDSIVKVVVDQDLANAKTSAENDIKNKIIEAIKTEISENDKLLDSAISVSVVSSAASAKSGDTADNFNYKVSSKVEAITFSEENFKDLITKNVSSKLGEGKMIVESGNQEIKYDVTNSDIAGGKISLNGSFSGFMAKKYYENSLKSEIKGKSVSTATTKLTAHDGILSADIVINPKFLRTLPFLTNRIDLEFIYGAQ